jgi:transcriptional antiterminator RfaH
MALKWYVLRSKAYKESMLEKELEARKVICFFPYLKVKPVNPRSYQIKPYFPNYLFVRANLDKEGKSFLKWIPYSQGLVQFGGEPAIVPDPVVYSIRKRLNEINAGGYDNKKIPSGDAVKIIGGPFRGYEGVMDAYIDGRDRVRLLMDMLRGRKLPVELRRQHIANL